MANIGPTFLGGTVVRYVLDTSAVIKLGVPENETGSSWMIQVKTGGATPGSFVIKQTVMNSGYSGSDLISASYTTTAASGAMTSAGTAVTASGIYVVISDGLETYLDYTGGADGMTITAWGGGA